jgi:hypothetical protein
VSEVYERQATALDAIHAGAEVREQVFGKNFDRLFPVSTV